MGTVCEVRGWEWKGLEKIVVVPRNVKTVVRPSKEKYLSWGDAKTSPPPVISIAKSHMFFSGIRVACGYELRQYFPAYLVVITTSFTNQTRTTFAARLLRLHCTDLEQFIFHQH